MPRDKKPRRRSLAYPLLVVTILAAIGGGLWVARSPGGGSTSSPTSTPSSGTPAKSTATVVRGGPEGATNVTPTPPPTPPPAPETLPKEDEDKIHFWLTESETPADAAAAMLSSWKQLSEPGRTAAAQHLSNLVADEAYEPLSKLMLDPESSPAVKEIFFADMLNRTDAIKWPLILKVMELKNHPLSEQARNMLTVVLGRDYGDDWPRWQERINRDILKKGEQPDGAAPGVGAPAVAAPEVK